MVMSKVSLLKAGKVLLCSEQITSFSAIIKNASQRTEQKHTTDLEKRDLVTIKIAISLFVLSEEFKRIPNMKKNKRNVESHPLL